MDITIVTPVYAPYYHLGGPAKSVPNLTSLLELQGYHVGVHTPLHGFKPNSQKNVTYYSPSYLDRFFNLFMRTKHPVMNLTIGVIKQLKREDCVVLNCGFYLPNLFIGLYAIYFLRCQNVIFIPRGSGSEKRRDRNKLLKNIYLVFENLYLRHCTLVKLDSNEQVSCYKSKKLSCVPNIITVQKLPDFDRPIDGVFLGRPELEKGVDRFIELARKFPRKKFLIMATHANQYTADTETIENITLLVEPSQDLICRKLEQSKLFYLYSSGEGVSMALLEAVERGVIPLCNLAALPECFLNIPGIRVISAENDGSEEFSSYLTDDLAILRGLLRLKINNTYSAEAVTNKLKSEVFG